MINANSITLKMIQYRSQILFLDTFKSVKSKEIDCNQHACQSVFTY